MILSGRGHTGCLSDGRGQVSLLSRFQQKYFDQHCCHHFCYHHHSKHQKHHHHNFIELSISLSLIPVMSRDIVSVRPPHQEPGPSKAGKKRNRWSWSACFTYQVHHHYHQHSQLTSSPSKICLGPNKAGKKRNSWSIVSTTSLSKL